MRIRVLSDLHLEFGRFEPPRADADLVVLAGDTHLGVKGVEWACEVFPDVPVVYVVGNHEYYQKPYPNLLEKLRAAAQGSTVRILERDRIEVQGVLVLGCTLWADLDLFGDRFAAIAAVSATMTDFRRIRVAPKYRRMMPEDMIRWFLMSTRWLGEELEKHDGAKVVVTHHAPSRLSLGPEPEGDPANAAYASDLEDLLDSCRPDLWIHGHIHRCADYRLGRTRVVCNPRGYADEPVEGFDPALVVNV